MRPNLPAEPPLTVTTFRTVKDPSVRGRQILHDDSCGGEISQVSSSLDELRGRRSAARLGPQLSDRDTVPGNGHTLAARNGVEHLTSAIANLAH
jgi:hypothetical protein